MFSAIRTWAGIALSMLVMPALAAQPFEGIWSENPAWCSKSGMIDEQPITITAERVDLYASSCRIDKTKKDKADFHLQVMCWDEGESDPTLPDTYTMTVKGNRMRIMRGDGFGPLDVQRCPADDAPDTANQNEAYTERGYKENLQSVEKCPTCWLKSNSCPGIFLTRPQIC